MTHIRLELARSGGFGAISMPVMMLDTADRTPEYAEEVASLVEAAERARLRDSPMPNVPDAMRYEITVRIGGAVRRLSFDDVTATDELRRLVERIQADGTPRDR